MARRDFVLHLKSALDGTVLPAGTVQTTHEGRPLLVEYDLEEIARLVSRSELGKRPREMWRYRELLPAGDQPVTLGETMTPILPCPRLAAELGVRRLLIKDESRLPTGSFKARGMAMAITMARNLGIRKVAVPSAGNAGGAAAAYAARARMECFVFMPADAPVVNLYEAALHGARVFVVEGGLIDTCGGIVREGVEKAGWFDLSTLKEPYRLEGKKTMGLELAEQLNWRLPDAIFYPTGGGTGLIGMWKAFAELGRLGWLEEEALPRMYACQSSGCSLYPPAYEAVERFAEPVERPETIAAGLRVPRAVGDFMVLDAVRESGGKAVAAPEESIEEWTRRASALEGISLCPESAVCLEVISEGMREGWLHTDETLVVFNTAAAQKYIEVIETELPKIDPAAVDWSKF